MKKIPAICFLLIITLFLVIPGACRKNNSSAQPNFLDFPVPAGFPETVTMFNENPLTEEGFQLGRRLFYDGQLSKDGNFPCASCHQQFAAFATFDHSLSHGFNNSFTTRNAPGLFNMAWQQQFHWDGGINHIEVQPLAPLTAPNEMAEDVANVVNKLKSDARYPPLFRAAFGTDEINSQRMLKALAQFMGGMVSANAKYDQVLRGEEQFSPQEQAGYGIFQSKCAACHQEPLFTDNSFRNSGIEVNPFINDFGRMGITDRKEDSLKFKVPSLRNVMLTFPYGHDGRFVNIEKVLQHYADEGVQQSATLDPLLRNGIPLTQGERDALVAFLHTLTDTEFIQNARFGPPQD